MCATPEDARIVPLFARGHKPDPWTRGAAGRTIEPVDPPSIIAFRGRARRLSLCRYGVLMTHLAPHLAPLLLRLGLVLFAAGAIGRIVRFARMPRHLRWELYPVPREGARSAYGGSHLEELDWWTRPLPRGGLAETRAMAREVLLLSGVREHNRPLWIWSWPFHAGLYLITCCALLLAAGGVAESALGAPLTAAATPALWRQAAALTRWLAWAGPSLAAVGLIGLIARRALDRELRAVTSAAEFANLVFLLAALLAGLHARLAVDPSAALLRARVAEILTGSAGAAAGAAVWPVDLEIGLFAIFIAYLPLTFMSHLYMKFFTYHQVRWDARPRRPGEPLDPRIAAALGYPVTWAAPHVGGDGRRTWADLAREKDEP